MIASRSALIVANGDYSSEKLRRLRAPARDADALARVLQDPAIGGFDVDLALDQPEHVLRRRIARFFAERRREDLLLLHISCHGLKDDDGHLFFAATDTEFDDLDSTALPEDFVRRQMAKSRSGRIVLLLDCCYSGAFSRGMAPRSGDGVELKERFAGRGRAVITASNAMEYSFEGDDLNGEGQPSVFTRAVVKALETGQADRDQDGWIAFDELYDYVYDEVRGCSPQHPLKWVDLEGELRIARSVYRRPAPSRTAVDHSDAAGTGARERPAEPAPASDDESWVYFAGVRAGAVVVMAGVCAVIASLLVSTPYGRLKDPFYRVPVTAMSATLIALVAGSLYYRRRSLLPVATGLAMVILGVTFPVDWPFHLPTNAGFWVGVLGAATAAGGAAAASWLAYGRWRADGHDDSSSRAERRRIVGIASAILGSSIVLGTLFVLEEHAGATYKTWAKWGTLRYPVLIIALSTITIALTLLGAATRHRRSLTAGAVIACLTLGEALPLIYNGVQDWGAARWLRLAGALLTVAALASMVTRRRPPARP